MFKTSRLIWAISAPMAEPFTSAASHGLVANAVARALCAGLSERFPVVDRADPTVRAMITATKLPTLSRSTSRRGVSGQVGIAPRSSGPGTAYPDRSRQPAARSGSRTSSGPSVRCHGLGAGRQIPRARPGSQRKRRLHLDSGPFPPCGLSSVRYRGLSRRKHRHGILGN